MLVYEGKLIRLELVGDSPMQLKAEGFLSPFARRFLKNFNKLLSYEKPIGKREGKLILSTWTPPIPSPAFSRLLKANMEAVIRKRTPEQVSIAITTRCSNKCKHCSVANVPTADLPFDVVKRVISDAMKLGTYLITFDGGEPLFRGDLEDMIRYVDPSKAITATFTSGYGLTERRAESLKASGLYAVRVSLDYPEAKEHDEFRGRVGAFRDAYKAVVNSLFYGLLVDLFVVIGPHNIDRLEDFYSLACDWGVSELSIYEIVPVGRWEGDVLSKEDIKKLSEFHISKNTSKDGVRVTVFPYVMSGEMVGCFAGRKWAHITATGDVLPCAYIPHSFGNVNSESFAKVWRRIAHSSLLKGCPGECRMKDPSFREKVIER